MPGKPWKAAKIVELMAGKPTGGRLGERSRAYRARKGLSQRRFADLVGVDQATISRLESGKAVELDVVMRIRTYWRAEARGGEDSNGEASERA